MHQLTTTEPKVSGDKTMTASITRVDLVARLIYTLTNSNERNPFLELNRDAWRYVRGLGDHITLSQ
jgi:hypothetical protein